MRKQISTILLVGLSVFSATGQEAPAEKKAPAGSRVYDIGIYVTDLDRTVAFYTKVFGLKVTRRWKSMQSRIGNGDWQEAPLPGVFLEGAKGTKLEFLQRGKPDKRQAAQEPINHIAIHVEDVQATVDRALAAGAKLAFPGSDLHYVKIEDLSVVHTQVIGLDGERIQILRELRP